MTITYKRKVICLAKDEIGETEALAKALFSAIQQSYPERLK